MTDSPKALVDELAEALQFYANHIHWMQISENAEFSIVLIAAKVFDMNGWGVAESALARYSASKEQPDG